MSPVTTECTAIRGTKKKKKGGPEGEGRPEKALAGQVGRCGMCVTLSHDQPDSLSLPLFADAAARAVAAEGELLVDADAPAASGLVLLPQHEASHSFWWACGVLPWWKTAQI